MSRTCVTLALLAASGLLFWGCSQTPHFIARDEPWRAEEEQACLSSGMVRATPFVQARAALGGPSVCGALQPFEMSGAGEGRIRMQPAAMLRCPMVPVVERWVREVVEPAARAHLGQPVVELKVAASYSCRPINHQSGGRLSEHGHANALDISAFKLADGNAVTVEGGWTGGGRERAFLRAVHRGACEQFMTVLGPDADSHHRDHFHLDLARRGQDGTGRICR
jgi:hypothetical protein